MPPRQISREVFSIDGQFGKYMTSLSTPSRLTLLRGAHQIPHQIKLISPGTKTSPESPPPGHTCAFEIFFSECGLFFPLPDILIDLMHEFGIALPQLCPNVIRTVLCLLTLAEEDGFRLALSDFLQLYAVKKSRTNNTFFLSPRKGFRVFEDFPEKDEHWRKSYFFFPVNELTYEEKSDLFVSDWTTRAVKVTIPPVSRTFASHFSNFCRHDLGWEALTSDRIRASGKRLRTRPDLAISSPPFSPRIFCKAEMSGPSYRAEKKRERERADQEKARILSDRVVMSGTLEDSKLRAAEKAKHLVTDNKVKSRQEPGKTPTSATKNSGAPTSEAGSLAKKPQSKDSATREAEKKRKKPEDDSCPSPRSSCPRLEEKNTGAGKTKEDPKEVPPSLVVLSSQESEARRSEPRSTPPPAPPSSFADIMRTLVAPGSAIAPFDEMKEVNKDNYLRFAGKLGKLILEFNSVFYSHEDQLSDKDSELDNFRRSEDENAHTVERASRVLKRMKDVEPRIQELEVNNIDLMAKLELRKLEEEQAGKIDVARKEERKKVKARFHEFSSKYGNFFRQSEEVKTLKVRVAETRANRELLEEIQKGEIPDIDVELESVRADEAKFVQRAAEQKTPRPDPVELTLLLADTPPEMTAENATQDEAIAINERGSNKGSTSEAGIVAMFPVDVEKESEQAE
ncbi:hypothetical protein ISN45_At01g043070 [Arabidopsis thaliana x Arabidopsis arenosa]|uniref:Transposase (putative) gypsy type domain-containing protein n=2 Tax=Arabidopsis TaxID=3701 RepID=F4I806_ARATH|nr:uncharacterized protein AT1G51172 [Arabidopsis thaliana]AEE32631.1 hypothetical protein AT1G51172 [Arabidopsis thaliana]KAG7649242.1 hypothetical protein ISN45_At01g043070 [Arabidopsis thaliana x Arabidopsis arenosa]|eukprot:NP_001154417.1 hypothetical protein AT1G51172 [Arabidopsis thaliana]